MNSAKFASAAVIVLFFLFAMSNSASAASSIDFSNSGGTLAGSNAGLTLTGSTLVGITGWNGSLTPITGVLGSVTFTTGALTSGSLKMGGTFAAGGSFEIDGNGSNGLPNGVLFSGTFSGPISWTLTTLGNGTHSYTLTGVLTGMIGGTSINAVTVELTANTGKGFFNGSVTVSGGDTTTASVPEPSSILLLGTGALAMFGMARRKLFAR